MWFLKCLFITLCFGVYGLILVTKFDDWLSIKIKNHQGDLPLSIDDVKTLIVMILFFIGFAVHLLLVGIVIESSQIR